MARLTGTAQRTDDACQWWREAQFSLSWSWPGSPALMRASRQIPLWRIESLSARHRQWTMAVSLWIAAGTFDGIESTSSRRKSKPILPKVYAQLVSQIRKRKVHEKSKTNGLTQSDPFSVCTPQSVQQQVSSYTRQHKPKQDKKTKGRRCHILTLHMFTRFHLEPRVQKVELVPKTVSILFLFLLPKPETDNTHPLDVFVPFRRQPLITMSKT